MGGVDSSVLIHNKLLTLKFTHLVGMLLTLQYNPIKYLESHELIMYDNRVNKLSFVYSNLLIFHNQLKKLAKWKKIVFASFSNR